MGNLKHTPGEWYNDGHTNGGHFIGVIINDKQIHLATVEIPIHDREDFTKEQAQANAKLMTAAPNLLETLIYANEVLKLASLIDKSNLCEKAQIECEKAIKSATERSN